MTEDDKVMTTEEACEYLRTTKTTLFKMVRKGVIPSARVGNSFRFLKSELEDFLRGNGRKRMQKKRELLEKSGFAQELKIRIYINNNLRKVFSVESVEDNDYIWLFNNINEPNPEDKWLFYTTKGIEVKDNWP